jgi:NADP-dependent 3-hydroxy acid dehydrogenase YdfG
VSPYSFTGKVCVITGAGSGIGRALAENLARRGAKLALSDVNTEGLAETVARCQAAGAEVKSDRLDVSERESVLLYADAVVTHFGTVNQIYNNAGIAYYGTVMRSEFKDIERVMDVDFWGVVHGTTPRHSCLPSSNPATATSSTSPACSVSCRCRAKARTTQRSSPYAASPRRCDRRCWSPASR